ncbi:SAM-dependent methyltransferase [Parafrankia sp. FMc6]|uniref:SAM-dependent methyltransferase n=1 Tax=Parafrankia soli TaxID=2599596 RepID=UPI0034D62245
MGADALAPVGPESPNVTRLYGFFLGGAHGFPADREAAATLEETWPQIRDTVRDNLLFLGEAVRFLAGEVGIRRFLDIGSSMPTMGNVHELAQQLAPDARVVYVDNDPVGVVHSQILLAPDLAAVAVAADLVRPDEILHHPAVSDLLDLSQPAGLLLVALLCFFAVMTRPVESGLGLLPGWDDDRQRRRTTSAGRLPVGAAMGPIR